MLVTAFLLGLTGSLHCVGMCSPIAMLIGGKSKQHYLLNRLTYHLGRTVTYMALGAATGVAGKIFQLGELQSILSIAGGIFILVLVIVPRFQFSFLPSFNRFIAGIKTGLGKSIQSRHWYAPGVTGLLNGFLPCGLVYAAVLLAAVQPDVYQSVLAMALFGLGTVPALLVVTYSVVPISKLLPISVSKLQTITLVVVAGVMIWRGFSPELALFGMHSAEAVCIP